MKCNNAYHCNAFFASYLEQKEIQNRQIQWWEKQTLGYVVKYEMCCLTYEAHFSSTLKAWQAQP